MSGATSRTAESSDLLESVVTDGATPPDVAWDDQRRAWLVSSYDVLKQVGLDEDRFRSSLAAYEDRTTIFNVPRELFLEFDSGGRKLPLTVGDQHDRLHRWWMRIFSPRRIADWRTNLIRPTVDAAIDRFVQRGRAELFADLADRVAFPVSLKKLGLPSDDAFVEQQKALLRSFALMKQAFVASPGPVEPALIEEGLALGRRMTELLMPYVLDRRSGVGDDLISLMWRDAAEVFDEPWSERDVLANVLTMFEGGVNSTSVGIANALYLLASEPDVQQEIREGGPRALAAFVEEALRLVGPTVTVVREAAEDTELLGNRIRKGDRVLGVVAAASRDPVKYASPHAVDLHRRAPRDHLAFWVGPRHCPGHAVARAQIEETVSAVLDRLADLRLDARTEAPTPAPYTAMMEEAVGGPPAAPAHSARHWHRRLYRPINVTFSAR